MFEFSLGFGDCCNGECVCHFDENGNQYRSDGTDNLNCRCKPAEVVCQPVSLLTACLPHDYVTATPCSHVPTHRVWIPLRRAQESERAAVRAVTAPPLILNPTVKIW